ncbi:hypothetical protein ACRRTK_004577 [Alexandromys fortis]
MHQVCKVNYRVGGLLSDHILTKAAWWLNGTPKVERMLNHEGALGAQQFTDPPERLEIFHASYVQLMRQQFLRWKTRQLYFRHNTPSKRIKPRPNVLDNGIEIKQDLATLRGVNDKMADSNSTGDTREDYQLVVDLSDYIHKYSPSKEKPHKRMLQ